MKDIDVRNHCAQSMFKKEMTRLGYVSTDQMSRDVFTKREKVRIIEFSEHLQLEPLNFIEIYKIKNCANII